MEDNRDEFGPIDVVIIGYPRGSPMRGDAVPIFLDLVDRGIIRVIDARFVRKDDDGTFSGFDLTDLDEDTAGDLTIFAGASTGLLSDDDVAMTAAEIEPGSAALMIVYENRWAAPFIGAVRRNGGVLNRQRADRRAGPDRRSRRHRGSDLAEGRQHARTTSRNRAHRRRRRDVDRCL